MELVTIHLIALCTTAIFIIIADHDGLEYIRGKKETLSLIRVKRLHYTVMAGLSIMIVTGAWMAMDIWEPLIEYPPFLIKMLMVAALVANSFVIGNLMHIATQKPFRDLSKAERTKLLVTGAISGICWLGAATIGLFFL